MTVPTLLSAIVWLRFVIVSTRLESVDIVVAVHDGEIGFGTKEMCVDQVLIPLVVLFLPTRDMCVVVFQIVVEEDGMWSGCTRIDVKRLTILRVLLVLIPHCMIVLYKLHLQGISGRHVYVPITVGVIVDPLLEFCSVHHLRVCLRRMCQVGLGIILGFVLD